MDKLGEDWNLHNFDFLELLFLKFYIFCQIEQHGLIHFQILFLLFNFLKKMSV